MSQVKPLKLLANGELSFIDSVNDELTMKTVTTKKLVVDGADVGRKLSLSAVAGDNIVLNVRDESAVSVASIDKDGNMIVQDLTVNGVETVVGNIIAQSELTVEGDFTVQGNSYLGNAAGDLINFVGTADTALKMGGFKITSLGAPTASGDAARLHDVTSAIAQEVIDRNAAITALNVAQYIDSSELSSALSPYLTSATAASTYLALAGGNLSGAINMGNNAITALLTPTASGDAANKFYVDDAINTAVGGIDFSDYVRHDGTVAMSADLNLGGFKITSLAAPAASGDATNKDYVDSAITALNVAQYIDSSELSSALSPYLTSSTAASTYETITNVSNGLALKLNLAGGTMSGAINMGGFKITSLGAPVASGDAVTKKFFEDYVDSNLANKLDLAGGTMLGAIDLGGFKITSLGAPVASGDATNKDYVDSAISALSVSGYIDAAELALALGDYTTTTALNALNYVDSTELAAFNYVDSTSLAAFNYVDSTELAAFNYVDSTSLAAFNYVDSTELAAFNYVDSTSLAAFNYVDSTELAAFNYVDSTSLAAFNYVDSTELAAFNYVDSTSLATTLGNYDLSSVVDSKISSSLVGYATTGYVDAAIAAATSSEDVALIFTASGAISAGSPVFVVNDADDTVAAGDASSVGTSRLIGVAELAISNAAEGSVTISGFATIPVGQIDGGAFTRGAPVYLSENTGKLTSTAPSTPGSRVYQVGVATATDKLVIDLKQGITVT